MPVDGAVSHAVRLPVRDGDGARGARPARRRLTWLRKAVDERSICIPDVKTDPRLDGLRAHPRVKQLLRDVGFRTLRVERGREPWNNKSPPVSDPVALRGTMCAVAWETKTVGRRRPNRGGLVEAAPFLDLVVDLRNGRPFIPKGVHRFRSFEESAAWSLQMMSRSMPAPRG